MKIRDYMPVITLLLCLLAGCDDKITHFDHTGSVTAAPVAIDASTIAYDSLPGQIRLYWEIPSEDAYEYLHICYYDPLTGEDVTLLASAHTAEMLIEDTRQKFGAYTFSFQTFNVDGEGSSVTEIQAYSGRAEVTYKTTEIGLSSDQLSSDSPEPTEGPIANLINGDLTDFFHSNWSDSPEPLPHYIQIDFDEEHEGFCFDYYNRIVSNTDGFPQTAEVQVSSDGETWKTVAELNDLPSTSGAHYESEYLFPGMAFTHFRFNVTSATASSTYFHMAEFSIYDVVLYDPEAEDLN